MTPEYVIRPRRDAVSPLTQLVTSVAAIVGAVALIAVFSVALVAYDRTATATVRAWVRG